MKKYVNYSLKYITMSLFAHLSFIFITIIDILNDGRSDITGRVAMIIVFVVILFTFDFYMLYMKCDFNITYYDDFKIVNRFLFNKHILYYGDICQMIYVGNSIVLLKKKRELHNFSYRGNVLRKYFKNEFMFYLGNDMKLLSNISSKSKCDCFIIGSDEIVKKKLEPYFKVIEIKP